MSKCQSLDLLLVQEGQFHNCYSVLELNELKLPKAHFILEYYYNRYNTNQYLPKLDPLCQSSPFRKKTFIVAEL